MANRHNRQSNAPQKKGPITPLTVALLSAVAGLYFMGFLDPVVPAIRRAGGALMFLFS